MVSTSSSRCFKYDVFLSFRGEDTRKTFVSHLRSELLRKGITTFKDDRKLECGDSLSIQLQRAIHESRLFIVVISENYASSRWCLDELEMIIECKKKEQLTVIPIFYEVDPSDVRNQRRSFAEAFKQYEDSNMAVKVRNWRVALTEVANITGVDSRACDVKEISKRHGLLRLQEQFLSQILAGEDINLWCMEHCSEVIKSRLRHQKVLIVLDDVDKSDQLDALAKKTSWFGPGSVIIITTRDKHLLVAHVVELIYEVKRLSEDYARKLFGQFAFKREHADDEFYKLSVRATKLAQGLPLALKVFGSYLCGRSKENWRRALARLEKTLAPSIMEVLNVSYDGLDEQEKDIFLHVACLFNGLHVNHLIKLIGNDELDTDFGIELLAEKSLLDVSIGGHVTVHELLRQMGRELVRQQSINEPGKRKFLLDSQEICNVLTECAGTEAVEGISLNISEITEIFVNDEAFNQMPNLKFLNFYMDSCDRKAKVHLRASEDYFRCKLRSLHWDAYPLKTLRFYHEHLVELNMRNSNLEKLWKGTPQLVNLKRMDLCNSINFKEVPDLSKATNLETLGLSFCRSLVELPLCIQSLNKLTKLSMVGCTKLKRMPSNINLKALESLNLNGCARLTKFPEISQNIKWLYLKGTAIEQVPESVKYLTALVKLEMFDCKRLRNFPKTIQKLKSLETVSISGSKYLTEFPHLPEHIKHLQLSETGIDEVPTWISNVCRLQDLNISENKKLKSISKRISELKCLQRLNLTGCSKVKSFPSEICETMSSLKYLYLTGTSVKELPENFGKLQNLLVLYADKTSIERVPSSISSLTCLTALRLGRNCYKSDGVPFQCPLQSNFVVLDRLALTNLNMIEVPNQIWHFPNLTRLDLSGNDFQTLPASIKELTTLKRLCLNYCKKLQSIPECPTGLQMLYARGCVLLEKTSHVFKLSLDLLTLLNCFKVDLDAQLLAQHMISFRCKEKYPRRASFPGSKMPAWFKHRTKGSSLTIHLPQRRYISELERFVACLVVAIEEHLDLVKSYGYYCCLRDTSSGEVFDVSGWDQNTRRFRMDLQSDHLILYSRDIQSEEDGRFDEFTFELRELDFGNMPSVTGLKIKECGVRLLFKGDVKEVCEGTKMIPSHFSQEECKDMSSQQRVGIENVVNTKCKDGDVKEQKPNSIDKVAGIFGIEHGKDLCQIEEGLFLGSAADARNKDMLKSSNVTHILPVVVDHSPMHPNDFAYKIIEVIDREDANIMKYFDECFNFIDEAKRSGGGVLVHCYMGISRSVTIVVAYLMKKAWHEPVKSYGTCQAPSTTGGS